MSGRRWPAVRGLIEEVLFPGRCLGCGKWLLLESDPAFPVCPDCVQAMPSVPDPRCSMCGIELISEKGTCLRCRSAEYTFHSHLSLFPYTGMAKCLLQALKFGGRRRLAGFFSCRAAYELEYRLKVREASAAIVPVPSRPGRKEPDAVELIARTLQSDHGLDVRRVLLRTAATQQKSLDYEQRRENLRGGIQVHPRFSGAVPRRVVLLDDVFTTGATLDACSRVLLQSGCQRVDALTLAMEE